MDTISSRDQAQYSTINNPEWLLQKLHLDPQGIYDKEGNIKYWEYLTRFNDITGIVVAQCFSILEKDENSFNWYSKVVSKVIEKILANGQLNPLSINTLPNDILDPDFLDMSLNILKQSPKDQSVILEIVEKSFGGDKEIQIISEKLLTLQKKGIKIAIDDMHFTHPSVPDVFSQGKKNLEDLIGNGLYPDIIKIDGKKMNILFDNKKHPDFQELIKTYKNRLAYYTQHIKEKSDRDLIVVAEWVNTHEEIQFAIDLGCNGFQGFDLPKLFKQ